MKTNKDHKQVLLTGGTSGIGYHALLKLIENGYNVILPCRNADRVDKLICMLKDEKSISPNSINNIDAQIVDLASIKDIKSFVYHVLDKYKKLDILILNAGMQYTGSKSPIFTEDGFETTFAINHLSNFYITLMLSELLLRSHQPRIVITSSEVHDPLSSGGKVGLKAGLGDLKGLDLEKFELIDGESPFSADKAYKDSKLCNILFGRELHKRLNSSKHIVDVIAWAPGLVIPRSDGGFFQHSRKYNELGQRLFAFIARDLFRITESPANAGNILFKISTSDMYKSNKFYFYSNKISGYGKHKLLNSATSSEASNEIISNLLWQKTCKILKLPVDLISSRNNPGI